MQTTFNQDESEKAGKNHNKITKGCFKATFTKTDIQKISSPCSELSVKFQNSDNSRVR
jgi:hypothetical protein